MAGFGVVLDANVLVPMALCDTLLHAAGADLYRIHWSDEILEEARRTLVEKGLASEERAHRRIAEMRIAFPDANVTGYSGLVASMTNDPKDRHVLAAAVTCAAQVIVTNNLSDFPEDALEPFSIEAQSPDEFLLNLLGLDPSGMVALVRRQAAFLNNPPKTAVEVLSHIGLHAPIFARAVENRLKSS